MNIDGITNNSFKTIALRISFNNMTNQQMFNVLWNHLYSRGQFSWIVDFMHIGRDVNLWMLRFSGSVRNINLSEFDFVKDVNLWRRAINKNQEN